MSEVNDMFDALQRASELVAKHHSLNQKRQQLNNVTSKICGNCYHWMKTSCYPEKQLKQFKSCSSAACKDFTQGHMSKELEVKFSDELMALQKELSDEQTKTKQGS